MRAVVDAAGWLEGARNAKQSGGRLVSLWGRRNGVCAAYALGDELTWLDLPLRPGDTYPDISGIFPFASRMQRAARDLFGVAEAGSSDQRPWLEHGAWPGRLFPGVYPFVRVEGDGVHEIPVGPVHAGIIEPGHFRFSVVGEKVLRLEERLGYTHKGIEKRFTELAPLEAHRLAGRVSGDSTVAFAWAYCLSLENALAQAASPRATWLRALMLERERVANHLGDLGALGNDAALAVGLAGFSRLREDWQRLSRELFGHRLMMDCVVPGGVATDIDPSGPERLRLQCDVVEREVLALRAVYDEHAGLQDRFIGAGRVDPPLAARLGLTGLAGRASGIAIDLRCDHPQPPYDVLGVRMVTHSNGDVAARVSVRFDEALESLRLIRQICEHLPAGESRSAMSVTDSEAFGLGWIEGWRGEVLVALELDGGRIRRCHPHDPSWQNWPVLEHAVIGNIVPDFPLINKSFNLSYSGHDV